MSIDEVEKKITKMLKRDAGSGCYLLTPEELHIALEIAHDAGGLSAFSTVSEVMSRRASAVKTHESL